MSFSIGIVGLPNVGKSTLFATITKNQVNCQNYPFCTINPNIGVVVVPDERVDKLAELTKSEKKIYTTVEFVDIAGLVKGANKGEGLGNKFLANIRETDAIVYVLRAFLKEDVITTQAKINPLDEKDILDTEFMLKDLETVTKRLDSLKSEIRAKKKEALKEQEVLLKIKKMLEEGKMIEKHDFLDKEKEIINQYQLLTSRPRIYLFNGKKEEIPKEIIEEFKKNNWPYLITNIITESEAMGLAKEERSTLGLPLESELDLLIRKAYEILDLETFFTTGPDETRAWTIENGQRAPQAGGVIHSDFEAHFIKADVINWKDLVGVGGFTRAREKGLIRSEGKKYIVLDGDVIEIKHNA